MALRTLILVSCISVVGFSGCALTTDRIELQYKQQSGVKAVAGASNVSVNVQVADQRQDKSKVSSKKNGFGMEMAPILAIEDVAVTVRKAIEQELRARGFQLSAQDSQVQITADMTRFYNDHKLGFFAGDAIADLHMAVAVKSKKGDLLFTKLLMAQGTEPNTQLMSGENARLALNRALENGMKSLFDDPAFIASLMVATEIKPASK